MTKPCPKCGQPLVWNKSEMWFECAGPCPAINPGDYQQLPDKSLADHRSSSFGVDQTLTERGSRYGEFLDQARIEQQFLWTAMGEISNGPEMAKRLRQKWFQLADDQRAALSMIFSKIARILNGDPNYIDNWHDIQGYAKLVEDRLRLEQALDQDEG